MSADDERRLERLWRLVGRELELDQAHDERASKQFLKWLATEARSNQTSAEREATESAAEEFAMRMGPRIKALRIDRRMPRQALDRRPAPTVCGLGDAIGLASINHCAPLLDMSVAAGAGRALWDEPCEEWIQVPLSLPENRYLGLKVTGKSMEPLLESDDIILVKLDAVPTEDDLVVAQRAENEYVVKRVAGISDSSIELESLNPSYERFLLPRRKGVILGIVIARFHRSPVST
jgi:Predicted transcriptional regulator